MSSVVNKALVAHTRGYKFIFIRSHHMKEVEKTKSNVSAIVWTPSATSRPICRWLKPQTNMPNWKKRKPLWKQKLLACAKFTARNSVRKHRSWWRCRSSARLLKKSKLIWANWRRAFADWSLCTQWPRWAAKWAYKRWQGSLRLRFKFLSRRCNYSHSRFTRSCWHMQEPVVEIEYL